MVFFWSMGLPTTQVRLMLAWVRGCFRGRDQEMKAGPSVLVSSSSLGGPLLLQVTFRSCVALMGVHSRVMLHQSDVIDCDLTRIWGRGTGSGVGQGENKASYPWNPLQSHILIHYLIELWHPPSKRVEIILQMKYNS